MNRLISFENVRKQFGHTLVLKDICFAVKKGEIFGLLGPNGAGKTTLIRSLLGLLKVNSGTILFEGRRIENKDIHKQFGFLPENFFPPQNLKTGEFLEILRIGLNPNVEIVNQLLEVVGLKEQVNKHIRNFSRGMIQRLGLCCALLKDPRIIVLDEPALGLDPLGQHKMLNLLRLLNKKGKTVFFSSHIISQIEQICSRIGIIHNGEMRYTGSVKEIILKHKAASLEEAFLKEIEIK
ncbi:MAG: ABC transporter ATP-binding protein [Candidatus Omnitrophica bacterium]|nr:ABC transporter ATP-binding protein [Candidatus Omnitrophota bacterium]